MEAQSFSLSVKGKRAGLRQRPKGSAYSQDNSCDTKDTGRNTSKQAEVSVQIAPGILYLMAFTVTAGSMWQDLAANNEALKGKNLFMQIRAVLTLFTPFALAAPSS